MKQIGIEKGRPRHSQSHCAEYEIATFKGAVSRWTEESETYERNYKHTF